MKNTSLSQNTNLVKRKKKNSMYPHHPQKERSPLPRYDLHQKTLGETCAEGYQRRTNATKINTTRAVGGQRSTKDTGQIAGTKYYKDQPLRRRLKSCQTPTQERIPDTPNNLKVDAKVKSLSKNWTPRAEKCPQISTETDAINSRRSNGTLGCPITYAKPQYPTRITSGTSRSLDD